MYGVYCLDTKSLDVESLRTTPQAAEGYWHDWFDGDGEFVVVEVEITIRTHVPIEFDVAETSVIIVPR